MLASPKTYTNPFDRTKWWQRLGATWCNRMERKKIAATVPSFRDASDVTDWAHRNSWEERPCDRLCKHCDRGEFRYLLWQSHSQDHFFHIVGRILENDTRYKYPNERGNRNRDDCVRLTEVSVAHVCLRRFSTKQYTFNATIIRFGVAARLVVVLCLCFIAQLYMHFICCRLINAKRINKLAIYLLN